jgi:hypothetical protein
MEARYRVFSLNSMKWRVCFNQYRYAQVSSGLWGGNTLHWKMELGKDGVRIHVKSSRQIKTAGIGVLRQLDAKYSGAAWTNWYRQVMYFCYKWVKIMMLWELSQHMVWIIINEARRWTSWLKTLCGITCFGPIIGESWCQKCNVVSLWVLPLVLSGLELILHMYA